MTKAGENVNRADLIAGVITLAILLVVVSALVVSQIAEPDREGRERYTFFAKNGGGLEPDDPVVFSGRVIGRVRSAEFTIREGAPGVLVEFEISPRVAGTYRWPIDSTAAIDGPRLAGNSRVFLFWGKDERSIEPGGEWTKVDPGTSSDFFSDLDDSVLDAQEIVEVLHTEIADEATLAGIRGFVEELEAGLRAAESGIDDSMTALVEAVTQLPAAGELTSLAESIKARRTSVIKGLKSLQKDLEAGADGASTLAAKLDALSQDFEALASASTAAAEFAEDGLQAARLLDIGRTSAELASAMSRAAHDPSAIGESGRLRDVIRRLNGGTDVFSPLRDAKELKRVEEREEKR